MLSVKDLKVDKKSSKPLAAAKTVLGLVLLNTLHCANGGSCLCTKKGFCLVIAAITKGAITSLPINTGVFLMTSARGLVI